MFKEGDYVIFTPDMIKLLENRGLQHLYDFNIPHIVSKLSNDLVIRSKDNNHFLWVEERGTYRIKQYTGWYVPAFTFEDQYI